MKKLLFLSLVIVVLTTITSCNYIQVEPKYESSDLDYLILSKNEEQEKQALQSFLGFWEINKKR